jgi:hypothetical protein
MKKTAKKTIKKAVKRTRKKVGAAIGSECQDRIGSIKFMAVTDPVITEAEKKRIQQSFDNPIKVPDMMDQNPKDRLAESLERIDNADLPEVMASIIDRIMGRLKRDAEMKREHSDIASKRFEEGLGIIKGIGR